MDKFAVQVIKENESVGHLPQEFWGIFSCILARGRKIGVKVIGGECHCKPVCKGLETPCHCS